jgi:hypothetical protein
LTHLDSGRCFVHRFDDAHVLVAEDLAFFDGRPALTRIRNRSDHERQRRRDVHDLIGFEPHGRGNRSFDAAIIIVARKASVTMATLRA